MNSIAFAVIVLVVLGLAGGIILVLASKFMAVYEDPRIAQITECLAGASAAGAGKLQLPGAQLRRAHGPQHTHPGHRGGYH